MNQRIKSNGARAVFIGLTSLLLLAGCAATGPGGGQSAPIEVSVEERAQERWDHLIARDFDAAWALYTPGFRETNPQSDFRTEMNRRPIRWLSASVRSADCEGGRCQVRLDVTYQAIAAPAGQSRNRITRILDETWIRLDGQWWFVQN